MCHLPQFEKYFRQGTYWYMDSGGDGSTTCLAGAWLMKQGERLVQAATASSHYVWPREKNNWLYILTQPGHLWHWWGNETSLRQRTPTKKCEKLKWQGCGDSLLNEWREWIEIYIYIAAFGCSAALRTKGFAADWLCQHSYTGEGSRIGPNIIFSATDLTKVAKKGKELCEH